MGGVADGSPKPKPVVGLLANPPNAEPDTEGADAGVVLNCPKPSDDDAPKAGAALVPALAPKAEPLGFATSPNADGVLATVLDCAKAGAEVEAPPAKPAKPDSPNPLDGFAGEPAGVVDDAPNELLPNAAAPKAEEPKEGAPKPVPVEVGTRVELKPGGCTEGAGAEKEVPCVDAAGVREGVDISIASASFDAPAAAPSMPANALPESLSTRHATRMPWLE